MPFNHFTLRRIYLQLAIMAVVFLVVLLMPPLQGVDLMPLPAHVAGKSASASRATSTTSSGRCSRRCA